MSESRIARTFERVCCRKTDCHALLFKATALCLREGGTIEVKCPKCNTFNYLLGHPDRGASEGVGATT